MTLKQLRAVIAGLPIDYEVRAVVKTETAFYVDSDVKIIDYEIAHDCKCLFLKCEEIK
jgi:hypothetical protein